KEAPMEYRTLPGSTLHVSAICLGTMTFGQQNSEAEGHAQLDYAFARGVNFIDTAEMYPVPPRADTVHATERIVGSWLARQDRDKVVLATKATGASRGLQWIRDGQHAFTRANLRAAVEGSLRRLQTDYIDLYQLHWPERNTPMFGEFVYDPAKERPFTPPRETLEALAELVDEGKIRHIGLSNEWPWGLMQFLNAAREYQLPRVVSVQNAYSLLNRTWETAMLEFCHREQIALLPYSPMAFGLLSGKYLRDPQARGRVTEFDGFAQRYSKPGVPEAVAAYAALAEAHGLSPAQLALKFVYSRWFVASTIIGATSLAQLEENLNAWDAPWSEALEQAVADIRLRWFNPAP
ncbi:aldo/keto reductase, partial [Rivihabitans pingtungensis]|uniref:aldo/keto reductase n=1 Tax=Rivihabitans pingtungensis TaxID=1054498 RepID=UPI002FD97D8C